QRAQPHPGADGHVEVALGADLEVLLELGPVQHRAAAAALLPQPLGHAALLGSPGFGTDAGGHDFLEPGHWIDSLWAGRWPRQAGKSSAWARPARPGPALR